MRTSGPSKPAASRRARARRALTQVPLVRSRPQTFRRSRPYRARIAITDSCFAGSNYCRGSCCRPTPRSYCRAPHGKQKKLRWPKARISRGVMSAELERAGWPMHVSIRAILVLFTILPTLAFMLFTLLCFLPNSIGTISGWTIKYYARALF